MFKFLTRSKELEIERLKLEIKLLELKNEQVAKVKESEWLHVQTFTLSIAPEDGDDTPTSYVYFSFMENKYGERKIEQIGQAPKHYEQFTFDKFISSIETNKALTIVEWLGGKIIPGIKTWSDVSIANTEQILSK